MLLRCGVNRPAARSRLVSLNIGESRLGQIQVIGRIALDPRRACAADLRRRLLDMKRHGVAGAQRITGLHVGDQAVMFDQ